MSYEKLIGLSVFVIISWATLWLNKEQAPSIFEQTLTSNVQVFKDCFKDFTGSTDQGMYYESYNCWQSKRKLTPNDLFLTLPSSVVDSKQCGISQTEDEHVRPERWGMYATDLACSFKEQWVYAPDYLDSMYDYIIEEIWVDTLMWDFVILSFKDNWYEDTSKLRWYFGHTVLDEGWKKWDTVRTWVRFAHANISGATTWWHTHIELRTNISGIWQSIRYATRNKEARLNEKRMAWVRWSAFNPYSKTAGIPTASAADEPSNVKWPYYFTHYGLGDISQNDAAPCISADGKDSCALQKKGIWTMALTVDIRNALWINLWDKVRLDGDEWCKGDYIVTDEMACRFRWVNAWSNWPCYYSDKVTPTPRDSNVKRPGTNFYIKWDLPGRPGWACTVTKL